MSGDPAAELLDVLAELGPEDPAVVLIVARRLQRTAAPRQRAALDEPDPVTAEVRRAG